MDIEGALVAGFAPDVVGGYPGDFVPQVRADVIVEAVGQEVILWTDEAPQPTYLDPIAKIVFSVIDGQATVAELAEDIREVYEIDIELALEQLTRVLSILAAGSVMGDPAISLHLPGLLPLSVLPEPDW